MRIWIVLILLTTLLVGCSAGSLSELDIKKADKDTKNFLLDHIGENGTYLYSKDKDTMVLLINNKNVNDSMTLYTIEDAKVAFSGGVCTISYSMNPVKQAEKADDFKLYTFKLEDDVSEYELIKNNELTSFNRMDIGS